MSNFKLPNPAGVKDLTIDGTLTVDGYTISPANATSGQALVYNGSAYIPTTQSGGVSSVSNSDSSLIISPTTGAVIASVDQSHNFTWTGATNSFTNTVSGVTPTSSAHLATKGYVDTIAQGLQVKPPVLLLAASNVVTLSGATTIDGVSATVGSRVLLTAQATATQNGIWIVQTLTWTRPTDFATGSSAAGAFVFVEEGTTYADTGFVCTTNPPNDVVDTNNLAFAQFSGTGTYTAGSGLTLTGTVFSIGAGQVSNSMLANGAVANLSGTNTGDQTITLTGNVTGSGTGSFAATIANSAVTYAKMQNASAANILIGRKTAGSGVLEEITPAGDVTLSGSTFTIANLAVTGTKIAASTIDPTTKLTTTGTPSSSTFLRGDNTWSAAGTGTVTSIVVSSPLTGGTITTTGTIAIPKATGSADGYLTQQDWTTFNNKGSGTVTSVATDATLTGGTITGSGTLGIALSHANTWTGAQTFNTASVIFGSGATATGAFNFDISGSSGTFVSSTGQNTLSGSVVIADTKTLIGTNNSITTNSVVTWSLQNTTAATVGAQKYSPILELKGNGWKTNATAASETVAFGLQVRPVQGAADPTGSLHFVQNINGGGYISIGNIDNSGNLTASGTIAASNFSGTHSGTSSGTNTGDQTITLTGNVTGSGTGSFATTIAASAVTNAMLAGSIVASSKLSATGTPSSTTYLRGDDTWATISAGTVTSVASSNGITGGTITTTGTLSLDTSYAATWTATQTFRDILPSTTNTYSLGSSSAKFKDGYFGGKISLDGYNLDLSAGASTNNVLQYNGTSFVAAAISNGSSNSDFLLTDTASHTITTYTPSANGSYQIMIFYRVITASTNLTLTIDYTDNATTAQTINVVPAASSQAVGNYAVASILINSKASSAITISATAGTANQVYVSGNITSQVPQLTGNSTGTVTSVATDSTLTGGTITSTGTLGLALSHANTWTGAQTFNSAAAVFGAGATATGSGNFDMSGSSGTFLTSTGAVTIGTGAVSISGVCTHTKHIVCTGTTMTVAALTKLGSTGSISILRSNDQNGLFYLAPAGSGIGTGSLATFTFAAAYGANPLVYITPANSTAAQLRDIFVDSDLTTTTTFTIVSVGTAPTTGTAIKFNYLLIG